MNERKKTKRRPASRGFRPTPENEKALTQVTAKGITATWAINEALRLWLPGVTKGAR